MNLTLLLTYRCTGNIICNLLLKEMINHTIDIFKESFGDDETHFDDTLKRKIFQTLSQKPGDMVD